MNERVKEKEEKLNKILKIVYKLKKDMNLFENLENDLIDLNNYYGSSDYFYDLEEYDKGNIDVPCGVLGEDTIWNMQDDIIDLYNKLEKIVLTIKE